VKPYNDTSPTSATLSVDAYRHYQKHVEQAQLTQDQFMWAIKEALADPATIQPKTDENGDSLLYGALLVQGKGSTVTRVQAFFVAIDPITGQIYTAYASTKPKNLRLASGG
jgi:hypothetical protein